MGRAVSGSIAQPAARSEPTEPVTASTEPNGAPGARFGRPGTSARALSICSSGRTPTLVAMRSPVEVSSTVAEATSREGKRSRTSANAADTSGADIEVPDSWPYPDPGIEDRMALPGARIVVRAVRLLNEDTAPATVVDPTLTAEETQAGEDMRAAPELPLSPLLP